MNGNDEEFIDPNKFSKDGTTSIRLSGSSNDDSLVVLSFSEDGSDWRKMIVFEVKSGESIGDTIEWIKFSGASWDNFGFYYSRYLRRNPVKLIPVTTLFTQSITIELAIPKLRIN